MIKVCIVDDHALVREGLKSLLHEERDMTVTMEASNAYELLERLAEQLCDVVILDISMAGKSGLDVLQDLKRLYSKLPIVILTMHPEERFAERAFKLGASGYVSKDSAPRELVNAIRKVMTGGTYVSQRLGERLASNLKSQNGDRPLNALSNREFEILRLIASGKRVSEIAEQLHLSVGTVYTYRKRILTKTKVHTDAELARFAVENKIVD
jgi:two-component system invasion response regulator UvrY